MMRTASFAPPTAFPSVPRFVAMAILASAVCAACTEPPHRPAHQVTPTPPTDATEERPVMPAPTPAPAGAAQVGPEAKARMFELAGASKIYDFRLTFADGCPEPQKGETCAGPATLVVSRKDRSTSPQTIRMDEAMVVSDASGVPLVNKSELYDDQGTVIIGDFNFDGREDFAMLANQNGSYGGPAFSVFLASASGPFVRSAALSKLTEETLGMFQIDEKKKRLVTLAKSGCCFHVAEELAIVNDKPVMMDRVTEDATGDKLVVTHERRVGAKLQKTVERRPLPK